VVIDSIWKPQNEALYYSRIGGYRESSVSILKINLKKYFSIQDFRFLKIRRPAHA